MGTRWEVGQTRSSPFSEASILYKPNESSAGGGQAINPKMNLGAPFAVFASGAFDFSL
jgi:hypothetical protein